MKRFLNVWTGTTVVGGIILTSVFAYFGKSPATPLARAEGEARSAALAVDVVRPIKGLQRVSMQPGSIQAYESVRLYAKVPGFLKKQSVDIGTRVAKGQVLAIVDVPEIETQIQRSRAVLRQADSRVTQMKARANSVAAELEAAKAAVTQAEATAKSSAAWVRFRQKQYTRMKELFALKSVDERLVDESKERYEASVETERSSVAAILTTKAHVLAHSAKVESAQADIAHAEAEVEVAQADLDKYLVQKGFATITAPFAGIVVQRSSFEGEFVRSANEGGGSGPPLLTVQRTDKMRVVVQVPDRDVPYVDPGDTAMVEIDALPGRKIEGTIARVASAEDAQTRLMNVEIDIANPTGKICHGMYGKVAIVLERSAEQLSIPSACLVGRAENGVGAVYVVRDKHAHLVKVSLGIDNGIRVGVTGVNADDDLILQPGNAVSDGMPVNAASADVRKTGGAL